MARDAGGETRADVPLTNLDQPLFDGAGATKRDLVDHLDGVRDRLLPELAERPLSVIRVHRGQDAFMQKNVPKGTPDWVRTVSLWAETSKREVHYAICDDRRTLVWFANQRAVELHPSLARLPDLDRPTHLVIDLDPPEGDGFQAAVAVVHLVREVLDDLGLAGAVKTSGAKGLHVFVPIEPSVDAVTAADFTIHNARDLLGDRDPWAEAMPAPQALPEDLVAEGGEIPVPRVAAMHEGKRRKRAQGAGS